MNIYNKENVNSKDIKIDYKELEVFTKNLGEFLKLYHQKVLIEEDVHFKTLNTLDCIHHKLEQRQYGDLINDPTIIS